PIRRGGDKKPTLAGRPSYLNRIDFEQRGCSSFLSARSPSASPSTSSCADPLSVTSLSKRRGHRSPCSRYSGPRQGTDLLAAGPTTTKSPCCSVAIIGMSRG